jgi:hypothetical protein
VVKISGFMTMKNEWPLAAVSVAHALINSVDKMYVVDNGSQDGTWQGLKILQEIFPDRLDLIYYESEEFNQKAIAHSLAHVIEKADKESGWGIFLDADEFLIYNNAVEFRTFLEMISLNWHSLVIEVQNYIPPSDFQENVLSMYSNIQYRPNLYFTYYELDGFREEATAGNFYWQQRQTQSKVIYRMNLHKELGHAAHQIEYGTGVRMISHDQKTAHGADNWGLFLAHLPYTSLKRLTNRTSVKHTEKSGDKFRFFKDASEDKLLKYFENMTINVDSDLFTNSISSGNVKMDTLFSESIKGVFPVLSDRWEEIISTQHVVAEADKYNFASLVEMSADYIVLMDKLWGQNIDRLPPR